VKVLLLDEHACVGHGRCWVEAPKYFAPDESGLNVLLRHDVETDDIASAERAVAACPERALRLIER
jgi:ferredoxin